MSSRFFDRRSFERVAINIIATISGPGGGFRAKVIDLSLGGLQLDATQVEPTAEEYESSAAAVLFEGAMTSVEFELPEHMGAVQVFARVRWRSGNPQIFGVEFHDPPTAAREMISGYIDYHVHTTFTLDNPVVE
ncbi:MAG: hypothetical protein ACJAYU_005460 [Bradymonadia bacterium]|jgi:hypothetical protein